MSYFLSHFLYSLYITRLFCISKIVSKSKAPPTRSSYPQLLSKLSELQFGTRIKGFVILQLYLKETASSIECE